MRQIKIEKEKDHLIIEKELKKVPYVITGTEKYRTRCVYRFYFYDIVNKEFLNQTKITQIYNDIYRKEEEDKVTVRNLFSTDFVSKKMVLVDAIRNNPRVPSYSVFNYSHNGCTYYNSYISPFPKLKKDFKPDQKVIALFLFHFYKMIGKDMTNTLTSYCSFIIKYIGHKPKFFPIFFGEKNLKSVSFFSELMRALYQDYFKRIEPKELLRLNSDYLKSEPLLISIDNIFQCENKYTPNRIYNAIKYNLDNKTGFVSFRCVDGFNFHFVNNFIATSNRRLDDDIGRFFLCIETNIYNRKDERRVYGNSDFSDLYDCITDKDKLKSIYYYLFNKKSQDHNVFHQYGHGESYTNYQFKNPRRH